MFIALPHLNVCLNFKVSYKELVEWLIRPATPGLKGGWLTTTTSSERQVFCPITLYGCFGYTWQIEAPIYEPVSFLIYLVCNDFVTEFQTPPSGLCKHQWTTFSRSSKSLKSICSNKIYLYKHQYFPVFFLKMYIVGTH